MIPGNKPIKLAGTDIRDLPTTQVEGFLRKKFDFAVTPLVVDMDGLLLLGRQARDFPASLIDRICLDWLKADPTSKRGEAIAWFELCYMTGGHTPPEELVQLLARLLENPATEPPNRDAFLLFLSAIYKQPYPDAIKTQIREAVARVASVTNLVSFQKVVREAIQSVLSPS